MQEIIQDSLKEYMESKVKDELQGSEKAARTK